MPQPASTNEAKMLEAMDKVLTLLEDLFILEASRMGMKKEALRQVFQIDKRRIGRIAKHVKPEKQESNGANDRN